MDDSTQSDRITKQYSLISLIKERLKSQNLKTGSEVGRSEGMGPQEHASVVLRYILGMIYPAQTKAYTAK